MKKIIAVLCIGILLLSCAPSPTAAPTVKKDTRMETNPTAEPQNTGNAATAAAEVPTSPEASVVADTPVEAEPSAAASYAETVIAAWETAGYLNDMAPYNEADLFDFYGIDVSLCKSAAGYSDAVGYTIEAVVVDADEATAEEIETLLSSHLAMMENQFRSYDPDALKLVEAAVLIRDGGRVVMIVSPDAEAMKTLLPR